MVPPATPPVCWEVESAADILRLEGLPAIRAAILAGRITATTKARLVPPNTDASPPSWSDVLSLSRFDFVLHVLLAPVWAHSIRGLQVGALIGMAFFFLSSVYSLFDLGNPVAAAVMLLCAWGIANPALPPQFAFFSSRLFWGALSLTLIFSYLNFGDEIWGKGVAFGVGSFFGALVWGALAGGLAGMAIGTLVGFVRRRRLEQAIDAEHEGATTLLKGVLLPLTALAVLASAYLLWVLPWAVRLMAELD